jgi:glycosyltransferase involved in cell wall biosynthesis
VIVTLHQFHEKTSFFGKSFIKKLLSAKFKLIFLETLRTLKKNRQAKMCHQLMHLLKAEGASLVVHTPREAEFLRQFYDFTRVHHHPISFLSVSDYHDYRAKMDPAAFRKQYGLGPGEIGIGLFGFISEYKGHHTAIKALKYLPKEYKMLFFGGQHPHSILPYTRIDPYLEELENLATTHEVADRIIFCSSLNDEEFIQALLCCDMTILPYMEVGQSGSGVAALTLELRVKALFSQNFAFLELEKYAENAIEKVSIGCALELASKLKNLAISEENSRKMALEKYHQTYNLDSNVDLYKRIFEGIEPSNNG